MEGVWFGRSPGARIARAALVPASLLYGASFLAYRTLYDLGLKRPYKASIPVLCVGNLAVGGSGKTPVTLHVADVLRSLGYRVIVGASGYGSPRAEAATMAPEGPLDPREWGDEPAMLRWLRPDLPLVIGRRRPLAAKLAAETHPNAVLLMDDGFQHLPLAKDLTLLLDPERPENPWPLPAGPYREPRASRRRADLILPGPEFRVAFDAPSIDVEPGPVGVVTAIARPERFLATVRALGFDPNPVVSRPDHDPLEALDLFAPFAPRSTILTTAKDWVKLSLRPDADRHRFGVVRREARIERTDGSGAEFAAWLKERIERIR